MGVVFHSVFEVENSSLEFPHKIEFSLKGLAKTIIQISYKKNYPIKKEFFQSKFRMQMDWVITLQYLKTKSTLQKS